MDLVGRTFGVRHYDQPLVGGIGENLTGLGLGGLDDPRRLLFRAPTQPLGSPLGSLEDRGDLLGCRGRCGRVGHRRDRR